MMLSFCLSSIPLPSYSLSLALLLRLTHSLSYSLPHSLSHYFSHSLSHFFSQSHSHTHSLSHSYYYSPLTLTLIISLALLLIVHGIGTVWASTGSILLTTSRPWHASTTPLFSWRASGNIHNRFLVFATACMFFI